jgi:hypothetical protein
MGTRTILRVYPTINPPAVGVDSSLLTDVALVSRLSARVDALLLSETSAFFPDRTTLTMGVDQPDARNTGTLPGVIRSELAGNQTITTPGTTLQDLNIRGLVDVRAANVTIRNCFIDGAATTPATGKALITATNAAAATLLVEDCTLAPAVPNRFWNGFMGHGFTARRCNLFWLTDPFDPFNTVTPGADLSVLVEQCYMHDFAFFNDAGQSVDLRNHTDGMQIQGGTGIIFRGNFVNSYWAKDVGDVDYNGGGSGGFAPVADFRNAHPQAKSCMQLNDLSGVVPGPSVSITDNWLYGGDMGISGNDSTFAGPDGSLVFGEILRNRFNHDQNTIISGQTSNTTPTIYLSRSLGVDCGEGTSDKNYYTDNGVEVLVRRV